MVEKRSVEDPKGLIFEAFRIEGITKPECRTIFLDWALSLPSNHDTEQTIRALLARHGHDPQHPMTEVLTEGISNIATPKRRGGWRGRKRD